jgi:hypothetical protein
MDHFLGTKPLSGMHAFDTGALQSYLERHLPGFAGPLAVEQFKGGQSNPTYKLITPKASYAMRSKPGPVAKLLPSAHAIEREFAVMSGLHGTDVPVPQMFCLCEDESVIGRAFYIMEFMQGRILWDQTLPGMSTTGRGISDATLAAYVFTAPDLAKFAIWGFDKTLTNAATKFPVTTNNFKDMIHGIHAGKDREEPIEIVRNRTPGAITIAFAAGLKLASTAWVNPATLTSRFITFRLAGGQWSEVNRSVTDIPYT